MVTAHHREKPRDVDGQQLAIRPCAGTQSTTCTAGIRSEHADLHSKRADGAVIDICR